MALQIRRGTDAERTAGGGVIFADGELIYVVDTQALYVGDGSTAGGVKLTDNAGAVLDSYITADTINSTLDLQQNLDLNGKDIIGTGNINISGTINATGNVNIGDDANTDTVDFAAQITSSLTPNADATYDLGTSTLKWNNIHAVRLDGDVEGSVFGDDSTLLVDSVNNKVVGDIDTASLRTSEDRIALGESSGAGQDYGAIAIGPAAGRTGQGWQTVAIGTSAGDDNQGDGCTAVGRYAGQNDQGMSAVAIGNRAGRETQGADAIAIGQLAGETNQAANSIVLNATGSAVENTQANSLVIKPIRNASGTHSIQYNPSTGEVTYDILSSGGLASVSQDSTPQLGGNLDVNGKDIVSTSNGDIDLDPNGSGIVVFKGNNTKGSGQFKLNCEFNSHGIIIKGPPHSAAASYTLTLPNNDGSADQVLKTDGSGNLAWVDQTTGGGYTRTTKTTVTSGMTADQNQDIIIDGFKSFALMKITTTHASWVRLYVDTASRTADASRDETTDPTPDSGVLAEVITTGAETVKFGPAVLGWLESGNEIIAAVKNKSGATNNVGVTLTLMQLEA